MLQGGADQEDQAPPDGSSVVETSPVVSTKGPLGGKLISAVCTSVRLAGTGSGRTNHLSSGMILGYVSLEPILCGLFRETITNQSG